MASAELWMSGPWWFESLSWNVHASMALMVPPFHMAPPFCSRLFVNKKKLKSQKCALKKRDLQEEKYARASECICPNADHIYSKNNNVMKN